MTSKNPEVKRIIEKYGNGTEVIYFDGKSDAKTDFARNLLAKGVDEKIISKSLRIPLDEVQKLKKEL